MKSVSQRDIHIPKSTAALLTIARMWKQHKSWVWDIPMSTAALLTIARIWKQHEPVWDIPVSTAASQ